MRAAWSLWAFALILSIAATWAPMRDETRFYLLAAAVGLGTLSAVWLLLGARRQR